MMHLVERQMRLGENIYALLKDFIERSKQAIEK
jgi:hypothetical protein